MFKIPKWEDDVPKSKIDFGKSIKKNKKENKSNTSRPETLNNKQQTSPKQNDNSLNVKNKNKQKQNKSSNARTQAIKQYISKNQVQNKINSEQPERTIKKAKKNKKPKTNVQKRTENKNSKDYSTEPSQVTKNNKNKRTTSHNADFIEKQPNLINSGQSAVIKKAKKRKHEPNNITNNQNAAENLLNKPNKVKKRKLNNDKQEEINEISEGNKSVSINSYSVQPTNKKVDKKKEKFKKILMIESNRNSINTSGNNLRHRMLERLKAAQFRFLNEKLYTTSGSEAQKLFQTDPKAFHTYHEGYQQQLKKWPVNPLDLIVKRISKMPKTHSVADMGCGEAALSRRVAQTVRSFDLVATAPSVEACDMARTPLLSESVDVAVYCLALMGTDLTQYLIEANRVLKVGGHLLIAEVESRFDKAETFTADVERLGFKLKNLDKSHQVFFFMEFTKVRAPPAKKSKLPAISLKPCLYKKR